MSKDDFFYVRHMIDAIKAIEKYTKGMSEKSFMRDQLVQDAVIRNLEIIGEAAKNISFVCRANYENVPWKQMAGMRDVLIHGYFGVDLGNVWGVVYNRLPDVKKTLRGMLRKKKL